MNIEEAWDAIVEHGVATEAELRLVTDIAGYSMDTLDAVVYSRWGYQEFSQWAEEHGLIESEDDDDEDGE